MGSEDPEEDSDADITDELDDPDTMESDEPIPKYVNMKFVFDFESGIDASRYHHPNMVAVMCLDDKIWKKSLEVLIAPSSCCSGFSTTQPTVPF